MATADDNSTQPTSASSPPSCMILIDPPDLDWWRQSIGLLYGLQSLGEFIAQIDPYDAPKPLLRHALIATAHSLQQSTRVLTSRLDIPVELEQRVHDYLASEAYQGGDA